MTMAKFKPSHFNWRVDNKVAVITLMIAYRSLESRRWS